MRALFRLLSAFLFGNILAGTEIKAVLLPANSNSYRRGRTAGDDLHSPFFPTDCVVYLPSPPVAFCAAL